jgi:hypothetical protein
MNREMNHDEEKNTKLEQLKRENAGRWAQLQLLQSQHHQKDALDIRAELARECAQISTISQPNFDPDPRAFLREVVETHDELFHTRAILEQRLQHEQRLLVFTKQLLDDNIEIKANLITRKEASNRATSKIEPAKNLREESNWLNDELKYVTDKVDNDSSRSLWSFNKLVQELIQRYLTSPSDPYLLVSSLPIHPNHVELLNRCHIIQAHEDNADLVCLTDYLEGTSEA